MSQHHLQVVIVGAGPAGIYAAAALLEQDAIPVRIDVVDRLPTPFGLVRYGVAPDHVPIRDVRRTLQRILEDERVRFFGNVEVGRDISVEDLRRHADAIIFSYGAGRDRRMGIPGEDLKGSISALDFVSWYCGHPDADRECVEAALSGASSAAVIGVGNVALDVARILLQGPTRLESTDMPQHVLDALAESAVRDVYILGRRSPARATFTSKELREFGGLPDVDILVERADLALDEEEQAVADADKTVTRNLAYMAEWAERPLSNASRRLHLQFWSRPVALSGVERVEQIAVQRTASEAVSVVTSEAETRGIDVDLVIRSVGHRSLPLDGLTFDDVHHVVPSDRGRIVTAGRPVHGEYVTGWLRRGPSGVIGTNKVDANETAAAVLEDAPELLRERQGSGSLDDLARTLSDRGLLVTGMDSWRLIDAAEVSLGQTRGRSRTTLHDRDDLLSTGTWRTSSPADPLITTED